MNDARREQIRKLAEAAREVADTCRDDNRVMTGEEWVALDWIADELADLDKEVTLEALAS